MSVFVCSHAGTCVRRLGGMYVTDLLNLGPDEFPGHIQRVRVHVAFNCAHQQIHIILILSKVLAYRLNKRQRLLVKWYI